MDDSPYAILGIHGRDVTTVNEYEDVVDNKGNVTGKRLVRERNVARVRMFVGEKVVDEDFELPELLTGVPDIEVVYKQLLNEKILERVEEVKKNVEPEDSKVVKQQIERIVKETKK